MPRYIADLPDLGTDLDDIDRRITLLEQASGTVADPTSSTTGVVGGTTSSGSGTPSVAFGSGSVGSGGGSSGTTGTTTTSIADGSITYIKLASDVPTTLDARFVNTTGDTMSGALTVGATVTANAFSTSGSITGSAGTLTSLHTTSAVTADGGLSISAGSIVNTTSNASMDLGTVGTSNTPTVNFHSSVSSTTYDGRIQASGGTASNGAGTLTYTAATHTFVGNLSVSGTFSGSGIVTSVAAGNQISITGTSSVPIVNVLTSPTFSGNVSVGGTLGVTGIPTFSSAAVFSAGITTKDFITGGSGSGLGNIAANTVQGYNVLDGSLPYAKLSAGAQAVIATTNPDTQFGFLRSATPSTADSNGTSIGNLTTQATGSRVADGLAYDGQALKGTSGTTTNGTYIVLGPFYGYISNTGIADNVYPNQGYGLKPGDYKAQVFMRVASAASSSACAIVDVFDVNAEITSMSALTVTPAMLGTTNYAAVSVPFTVTASSRTTTSGNGIQIRVQYQTAAATDVYVSHVIVTPAVIGQGEITTSFFRDLSITSAKINDLTAAKITTGTLTADITQSGTIRTGPDSGARVLINSGGIAAYSSAATQTVSITSAGAVSITGTINATGGTFSGTVSGGTFQGGTFQTGTGTTSIVRFDSTSIKAWNSSGVNTFSVLNDGSLTATSATITGTVNATGGTFSGSITASGTITGGNINGANINSTNVISGAAITAGTITSAALNIAAGFSDNQILNGGFEDETSPGSGLPASWTLNYETTGTAGTGARGTTNANSGSARGQITNVTSGGTSMASSSIPCSPGDVISLRLQVRGETNPGPFYIRIFGGTTAGFARGAATGTFANPVLTTNPNAWTPTNAAGYASFTEGGSLAAAGAWNLVEGTITVPAGVTWLRVGLYAWAAASGWVGAFDDVVVRKQLTTTQIADGVITTNKIVVTGISGAAIQANTLSANRITTSTLNATTLITIPATSGTRIEIDGNTATAGLRAYTSANVNFFNVDAVAGTLNVTGQINATSGTFSGSITASGTITGGTLSGATISGGTITGNRFYGVAILGNTLKLGF